MQAYYASVDDIDLYPGALSENAMSEASVGPVLSCLIAENFAALKLSDRFFFETSGQRGSFTSGTN